MVDDGVIGYFLLSEVSLSRFHVVHPRMTLNEALKLSIHNRSMSQSAFLSWGEKTHINIYINMGQEVRSQAAICLVRWCFRKTHAYSNRVSLYQGTEIKNIPDVPDAAVNFPWSSFLWMWNLQSKLKYWVQIRSVPFHVKEVCFQRDAFIIK